MIKINSAVHVILFLIQILKSSQFPTTNFNCKTPDGTPGTCVEIKKCQSITNFIKENNYIITQELRQFLNKRTCEFIEKQVKVCCSEDPIINNPKFESNNIIKISNDVVHKNAKLLPSNCGINKNQNVALFETTTSLYGQEAILNEFPWMVMLSYSADKGPAYKCVGTIINERYILTAASCIDDQLLSIRVGEHNTAETYDCQPDDFNILKCSSPTEDISIEKAFRHEEFQYSFTRNDIGLIRLSKPLNIYSENVKAICLPLQNSLTTIAPHIPLTLTGWGVTNKNFKSKVLLKADVSTITRDECNQAYTESSYNPMLSDKQFCIAGKPNDNRNICGGDKGSPLQMYNGTRYTQFGIVSIRPYSCVKRQVPYINTRVDQYIEWILNNIEP